MATDEKTWRRLADAVRAVSSQPDRGSTLQEIVDQAVTAVPGFAHAGITLRRADGTVDTPAATDELVRRADEAQYELQEGPCIDAVWVDDTYTIPDLREETRWPRWAPVAADLGIRSVLSVRIATPETVVGGVNLYATEPCDRFDPDVVQQAHFYADAAGTALAVATRTEGLSSSLQTRHLIGMAQGILMQRYQLDTESAFAVLRRQSQDSNVKLRDVARQVVDGRADL